MRWLQAAWIALAACGGAAGSGSEKDPVGGKADDANGGGEPSIYAVGNRLAPWDGDDQFLQTVQPVLAQRCVTCHSCGDSPCQLKLSSFEGVLRGSNERDLYGTRILGIDEVYDPAHLDHGRRTDDRGLVSYADTEGRWRKFDFYSVIEHGSDAVLARVLTEAQDRTTSLDQSFAVGESLDSRAFECVQGDSPDGETMVGRAMPLGLPAIDPDHAESVVAWLDEGAASLSEDAQRGLATPANETAVEEWEEFFNPPTDDLRGRLIARYVYEHVFFANLHLERSPGEFYRLVRSRSRTGPIDQIVTELPNDDPGEKVFYRLRKQTEVFTAKQHIAWEIGPDTMDRWQELLHDGDWDLTLHDEFDEDSTNPFEYFAAIPARVRYQFMIENSREMVDAMVRGSVCVGNGATFAIRDRFWVWFLDPESDPSALEEVAGQDTHGPLLGESSWFHLNPHESDTTREIDYLRAYRRYLQQLRPEGLGVEDLWDGNGGAEADAWLTVSRHGTSASVETGARQGQPETVWVLGYSNFERLYYNLVVEFETWGGVGHKLDTWGLMSMVRSEGEDLFLTMLPSDVREDLREHQTRGWGQVNSLLFPTYADCSSELEEINGESSGCVYGTSVAYDTHEESDTDQRIDAHVADLAQQVREHIGGDALESDPLNQRGQGEVPASIGDRDDVDLAFDHLTGWTNPGWEHVPEITYIRVNDGDRSWMYTMLANRIYTSHDRVYFEGLTRVPDEDTLSVSRGIVGARPNLFIDVDADAIPELVESLAAVVDRDSWATFVLEHDMSDRPIHVIDRRDPVFWTFLDEIHDQWFRDDSVHAAVLDVSEYLWPQEL